VAETGSGLASEPRRLDTTDLARIARFRAVGYGGSVSDAL